MYRYAGHFAYFLFHKRIQRRAGDSHIIALNNGKFIDLHLQLFTGTAYQNALLFQWADKLQNTANIVDGGAADLLGALHDDLRTDTVTREQFL